MYLKKNIIDVSGPVDYDLKVLQLETLVDKNIDVKNPRSCKYELINEAGFYGLVFKMVCKINSLNKQIYHAKLKFYLPQIKDPNPAYLLKLVNAGFKIFNTQIQTNDGNKKILIKPYTELANRKRLKKAVEQYKAGNN